MAVPSEIADVVELWVWSEGYSMTISQLESHLETSIPEESIEVDEVAGGEPFEYLAEQVFDEILDRQDLLGDSYPFACDGTKVRYLPTSQDRSTYIFCLLLSHLSASFIENDQRAMQFETVAMEAARSFFGGQAIRIGAPWSTATYAELLEEVIALIPTLKEIDLSQIVTSGDRGWDILIVKNFCDKSFPHFVALGNCATGRNDWKRKGMEVVPEYFWQSFRHPRPGVWITFSAVPFKMTKDTRERKANASNMTFDRFRICELAPEIDGDAAAWVLEQKNNAKDIALDSSS